MNGICHQVFFWIGLMVSCIGALGLGAWIVGEVAMFTVQRAIRHMAVGRELAAFMWDRAQRRKGQR